MRIIQLAVATAILATPLAALAQSSGNGSDKPPATQKSAVPGATTDGSLGTTSGNSTAPTNGTSGGGMSAASGVKAGGQAKQNKTTTNP